MKCPHCGAWTSVEETREHEFGTTRRRRLCANGHTFPTVEIPGRAYTRSRPALLLAFKTITAAIEKWRRDMKIATDPRPSSEVAVEFKLHHSEVNKIRARYRRDGKL